MKQEAVTTESLIEIMNHQLDIIDEKDKEIAGLQQKLDYMIRQKFASSSEKFPNNQPSLFQVNSDIEAIEDEETIKVEYERKKRGNKKTPPESLPRVRVEHDLNEDEKVCDCGCDMKRIKD